MNKSIIKTRNELERITYKINQLKNKYSCENVDDTPTENIYLRPSSVNNKNLDDSLKKNYASRENVNISQVNSFQETYKKDFRMFRNQVYQYLENHLSRIRDEEPYILSRVEALEKNSISSVDNTKIARLEQQVTSIISISQDLTFQLKQLQNQNQRRLSKLQSLKSSSEPYDLQEKIRNIVESQVSRIALKIKKDDLVSDNDRRKELKDIRQKMEEIKKLKSNQNMSFLKINRDIDNLRDQILEVKIDHQQGLRQIDDMIHLAKKVKNDSVMEMQDVLKEHIKQIEISKQTQRKIKQDIYHQFQKILKTVHASVEQSIKTTSSKINEIKEQMEQKMMVIDQQIKFTRDAVFSDIQNANDNCSIQHKQILKNVKEIKQIYEQSQQQREKLDCILKSHQTIEKKINENNKLQSDKITNQYEQFFDNFKNIVEEFQDKISNVQNLFEHVSEKEDELSKKYDNFQEKLQLQKQSINEIHEQYESISQASVSCSHCTINDWNNQLLQVKEEISKNISLIEKDIKNSSGKNISLEIVQALIDSKIRYLQQTVKDLKQVTQVHTCSSEIEKIKNTCFQTSQQNKLEISEQITQFKGKVQEKLKKLTEDVNFIKIKQNEDKGDIINLSTFSKQSQLEKSRSSEISHTDISKINEKIRIMESNNISRHHELAQKIQQNANRMNKVQVDHEANKKLISEQFIKIEQQFQIVSQNEAKNTEFYDQQISKLSKNLQYLSNDLEHQMKNLKEKCNSLNLARLSQSEIIPNKSDDCSSSYLGASRSRIFDTDIATRVSSIQQDLIFIRKTFVNSFDAKLQEVNKKISKKFDEFSQAKQHNQQQLKSVIENEVYNNMGTQFTKISQILQRTFEELEEKNKKTEFQFSEITDRIQQMQSIIAKMKNQLEHSRVSHQQNSMQERKKLDYNILNSLSSNAYMFQNSHLSDNTFDLV